MSPKEKGKAEKKPGSELSAFLAEGKMDLAGLEEVRALYSELALATAEELPLERKVKALPPEQVKMRLNEGFSLADPSSLLPKEKELARKASEVAAVLARHSQEGKGGVEKALGSARGREALQSLARVYLDKGEEELRGELSRAGLDPQIGTFVLFNALKGVFLGLGRMFAGAELTPWEKATCPVCGGAPAVGTMEGDGGKRHLICHRCETKWSFRRITCPFCGNDDHQTLGYLRLENGGGRVRADYCDGCKGYLKVWDLRDAVSQGPGPQAEDLLTPRLDLASEDQGYRRGGPNIFGVRLDQGKG